MMSKQHARMLALGVLLSAGCAHDDAPDAPPARVDEPIGVQMMRVQPVLRTQKFRDLLSFEAPDDLVFVTGAAPKSIISDSTRAHAGKSSARVSGGILTVKLSSLITDGSFPGKWTLAGAYVYAPQGGEMTISCQLAGALVAQRKVTLAPAKWTPVMVDVALLGDMRNLVGGGSASAIVFTYDATQQFWCDDVSLMDNSQTFFGDESAEPSLSGPWLIRRRGLNYLGTSPGRFDFKLPTAEQNEAGWTLEEVNALRARFSSAGPQKSVTIYSDGRAYFDGEYRPLSAEMAEPPYMDQRGAPGGIEIAEEFGRVNRNTPGDANNDGFNETRGAYQVQASGPRVELTLAPQSVPVMRPVLEISGVPAGAVVASIEGRVVEGVVRLDDGTLLIDIPARINRPTSISVKLQ
jgi:hypothetical protein